MMQKGRYPTVVVTCVLFMVGSAWTALATPLCISAAGDVQYELDIGVAGDAVIVNGKRFGTAVTTLSGTGFSSPDGSITIGFNTHFDWGSSDRWVHPASTAVLKVSPTGVSTYDITYHGNSATPPHNTHGTFTIVVCPVSALAGAGAGSDPNH